MFIQLDNSQVPPGLTGAVLVTAYGIPGYRVAVWSAMTAGALEHPTLLKKLPYLDDLYRHANELRGCSALNDALASLDHAGLAQHSFSENSI